jgi:hypothetical protein
MISRPDLQSDFQKLANDTTQMANEYYRLREINARMLAALQGALPILEDCAAGTADPDWTKEIIAKVQNAIADAASDS